MSEQRARRMILSHPPGLYKRTEEFFVRETDSIKALENQASNTKLLMDRLNRAAYGLTFDELIKALGKQKEGESTNETEN